MRITKIDLELKRKLFHQLALLYFGINLISHETSIKLCAGAVFIGLIIEVLRLRFTWVNNLIRNIFGAIMRPHEKNKMSGLIWTLMAMFIVVTLYEDRKIVNATLTYLVFGDTAAALIGILFGKIKLGKKTLEGSISCFIVCFVLGFLILKDVRASLGGALVATLIEFLRLPLSDNFWIPVISSFVIYTLFL